uniref:Uncharacterized protein n=1 Tax=Tanacetum cinerariifolium TaxID=118510 RepID=A0A6L2P935_TANCI|nr:hypothetical protein [Tanacetum cinerariifolium]
MGTSSGLKTWYLIQCRVKNRSAMTNMHYRESLIGGVNVNSSTDLQSIGILLEMSTQNVELSLSPNFRSLNGMITSIWIGSRKADKSDGRRTLCFQRLSKNVHKKHHHPTACGRSLTRCRKLPKEAQPHKAGYVPFRSQAKGSNGTLNDVRTALDDHLKGIRMKYLPQAIRRKSDKERAAAMIQAIDKQLKTRRVMRSLEKFVGGKLYEGDFRMQQRTR